MTPTFQNENFERNVAKDYILSVREISACLIYPLKYHYDNKIWPFFRLSLVAKSGLVYELINTGKKEGDF